MQWQTLAATLFPLGHTVAAQDDFLSGEAQVEGGGAGGGGAGETATVAVIGTTGHAPIGVEIALAQATAILRTVREHPGRAIVILVDTQGQRLRHRDEMLGINSYMAHLGKCVELARRRGHKIVALVYDQALSGGFITSGLMADACYALPDATIRVMGLAAMARITKVPEELLTELALSNPVFAPGPENYLRMGGLRAIWDPAGADLAALLKEALLEPSAGDDRSALGLTRGGRLMAQPVIAAIMAGGHVIAA
ncbi:biotin-independent malonate decarboxylase subunit gamma [Rugamonas sp.]|uniref:biotin-independent malonate decarboxylase subunit gamma n=1 Tax=Rugamonas sp. TaxID=1926287 RepID=UPI0025CEC6B9|nr:biotin-independent malonate decarboxylase subunit gamma [Rugamonas sp.]